VRTLPLSVAVLCVLLITPSFSDDSSRARENRAPQALLEQALLFEKNEGQAEASVKYLARSAGGVTYFFTAEGVTIVLAQTPAIVSATAATNTSAAKAHALKVVFLGANANPEIVAEEPAGTISNYLIGNERSRWRANVSNFRRVRYHNLYEGIDLVYYGNGKQLEYDFIVHAGANPNVIRLRYEGSAEALRLLKDGSVTIATSVGLMREMKPFVYQLEAETSDAAKRAIAAQWRLVNGNELQFALGAYDHRRTLYIDPLLFSTFVGGSGNDHGYSLALDLFGNAYITGQTSSLNFPTTVGAFDLSLNGAGGERNWGDVFVAKLNSAGTALVYNTVIGGNSGEAGASIAVDRRGNAFITGATYSENFPTTASAFDTSFNGGNSDAFVLGLDPTGSKLVYSTFLGGNGLADQGLDIALDELGYLYVAGHTSSTNFPLTPNAYDLTHNNGEDVFVAKLATRGPLLVFSTLLGGEKGDCAKGLVLDAQGNVYITGITESANFPATAKAFDATFNGGGNDAFVAKLNAQGSALLYSTFLGGAGKEDCNAIARDDGNVIVAGCTASRDFPTTSGAYDTSFNGAGAKEWGDVFLTKLNSAGNALLTSTFLGNLGDEHVRGLALDEKGDAYLAGYTSSPNFPTTTEAVDATHNGSVDVFFAKLNRNATKLEYGTLLGGGSDDYAYDLALLGAGGIYLCGYTSSANYATTLGALDESFNGGSDDAFVAKLNLAHPALALGVASPQRADTSFWVSIKAGDALAPVSNLFGLSFVLNYNHTEFVDVVAPLEYNVIPGGEWGYDAIHFATVDDENGKLNLSLSRLHGATGLHGDGVLIFNIKFLVRPLIPEGTQIQFALTEVKANDPSGFPIALVTKPPRHVTITHNSAEAEIWPGDTNDDSGVDAFDVLPIGLHWSRTGEPRKDATLQWLAQTALAWRPRPATYADADGDGKVDQADLLAIGLNFGKSHSGAANNANVETLAKAEGVSGGIQPEIEPEEQLPGETFDVEIKVTEVSNLFGVAFKLYYDRPDLVQVLAVEPEEFLGNEVVFFSHMDAPSGKVEAGVSRKAGQRSVSGTGVVVRVKAKLLAHALAGAKINFTLAQVSANNANGAKISLTRAAGRVVVKDPTSVDEKSGGALPSIYRLEPSYPNPARITNAEHGALIRYQLPRASAVTVKIYNTTGQEIRALVSAEQAAGYHHVNWDGRDEHGLPAPSGIYLYRMQANGFTHSRKLMLLR